MPQGPLKRAWSLVTLFQDLPGPSVYQLFLYQLCTIILNSRTLGGADVLVSKHMSGSLRLQTRKLFHGRVRNERTA